MSIFSITNNKTTGALRVADVSKHWWDPIIRGVSQDGKSPERARAMELCLALSLPVCVAYFLLYILIDFAVGALATITVMAALLLSLAAARWQAPSLLIINFMNVVVTGAVAALAYSSGGVASSALIALFLPVSAAFLGQRPRMGFWWGGVGIAIIVGLYVLERRGGIPALALAAGSVELMDLCVYAGFMIYMILFLWTMYLQRREAVAAIAEIQETRQNLIQTLAHDLKNPVAGIVGRIYLMERRLKTGVDVDTGVVFDAIKRDASAILVSIDRMILLSRSPTVVKPPEMRVCDLRAILADVIAIHKAWMDAKGIQFNDSEVVSIRVLGDRELLVRLFENIVSNAIKYSYPQSKVECRVREELEGDRRFIVLEVADSGVGMDPREAEDFFKLEYRPNRPTAGESSSGIGSSLMRDIVAAMGGKIWLTSAGRDKGTVVSVRLPRADD